MIRSCDKCGGLYVTENLEMFAGRPCVCGAPRKESVAPPEIRSTEWMDALARELRAEADKWGGNAAQLSPYHWTVSIILGAIANAVERANESASIDSR